MTTEAKPSPRERLLDAAATLTYRDGVNIGVEALCKAAGVSKRSMYQLFESKDELLAASLEQRTSTCVATLLAAQIELKDENHPASRVARRVKENLTGYFHAEAEQGGAGRAIPICWPGSSAWSSTGPTHGRAPERTG